MFPYLYKCCSTHVNVVALLSTVIKVQNTLRLLGVSLFVMILHEGVETKQQFSLALKVSFQRIFSWDFSKFWSSWRYESEVQNPRLLCSHSIGFKYLNRLIFILAGVSLNELLYFSLRFGRADAVCWKLILWRFVLSANMAAVCANLSAITNTHIQKTVLAGKWSREKSTSDPPAADNPAPPTLLPVPGSDWTPATRLNKVLALWSGTLGRSSAL